LMLKKQDPNKTLSLTQKDLFYILVNGFRSLR
jgi:hypothetical protein